MDTPITRAEHEEFVKRMDEANQRQSKRISILEDEIKELQNISVTIERLAVSMENMAKEQKEQGKRLETLENRDGEMWRKVMGYIASAIIGAVICYMFAQIGM